ncbi:MAG: methyltransferase FkbM family [Mycobacterium sp.]|jgi:FkbM family methyltransferase|nr:methyltransferase FkbM family [Mycobacterium sp.]
MSFVCRATRRLPLDVAVAGRKRNAMFQVLDPLFRASTRNDAVPTEWGDVSLDGSHPPERLLSYLFYNIMRYYEKSELGRYIARVADPDATFIDIGANLGMYALVARGHRFKTIVVEPEPRHSAFLQRNEHVFGKVLPFAFSDRAGALPLYYEPANPGASSLFPGPDCLRSESVVPVHTFSEIASRGDLGDLSKIRLIKIDVEGLEAEVVAGMCDALGSGWRPNLWCEVRGDRSGRNGGSYRNVRDTLSAFGYVARELKDGRDLALDEHDLAQRAVFDLLFTPQA